MWPHGERSSVVERVGPGGPTPGDDTHRFARNRGTDVGDRGRPRRRADRVAVAGGAAAALLWAAALPLVGAYANPDGVAYLSIARRWLAGEGADAVTGYWGPLLSWASAPLLAAGVPPLLALRAVLGIGAVATVVVALVVLRRWGASTAGRAVAAVALAPLAAGWASFGLYPDVVMGALLLVAVAALLDPLAERPAVLGAVAGASAGAAYLAKSFALPFFLAVLPVAVALRWWSDGADRTRAGRGRRALVTAGVALAACALVAGPWIVALSARYGEPTYSTSGSFNADLVAPGSPGNPLNAAGLYPPPAPTAISAWDEPSALPSHPSERGIDVPRRQGLDALVARADAVVGNVRVGVGSLARRAAPAVLGALVAVGLALAGRGPRRRRAAVLGLAAAAAVFAGGYTLLIVIERYLWFPVLVAVMLTAVAFDRLPGRGLRSAPRVGVAVLVVATAWLGAVDALAPRVGADGDVEAVVAVLAERDVLGDDVAAVDDWHRSVQLCLRAGCRYHGLTGDAPPEAFAASLHDRGIDHLVVWTDTEEPSALAAPSAVLTVYAVGPVGLTRVAAVADTREAGVTPR